MVDVFNFNPTILDVQLAPASITGINENIQTKKLLKKIDLLGREGSNNTIQIKIFNDGSTKKIINNKN